MHCFTFEGIGTHWKVLYFLPEEIADDAPWNDSLEHEIQQTVEMFDRRYSRFKEKSLVWKIAKSQKKYHTLSAEFADILSFGDQLRILTSGRFNPAVGFLLENLGYDREYSFQAKKRHDRISFDWSLHNRQLHTPYPVLFDIGGWGKGYLIDLIAALLKAKGLKHYLVDGGGDVFATQKPDGTAWRVPLEHPLNQEQAFALVELKDSAIACSGSTLRTFGNTHHLIDLETGRSVHQLLGVYTQAATATIADGAATAIFVDTLDNISQLANTLSVQYLVVTPELKWMKSSGFVGDIFVA